jgi:uncharacterized protein with HEPN domain
MNDYDLQVFEHILRHSTDIESAIKRFGNSYETFCKDVDFYKSVSMSIFQIGELSKRISSETKNKYNDIPWVLAQGMRNIFAHDYDNMQKEEIWETAIRDIPDIHRVVSKAVNEHYDTLAAQIKKTK